MSGAVLYRTPVAGEWIDYNGHLRDAYYSLIVSLATDELMVRLGIDEHYRQSTRCTLYTVEMHMHFLREVLATDVVEVSVRILGIDRKRIHAGFDLRRRADPDLVASAELMLLHVRQGGSPAAVPFPEAISATLGEFSAASAAPDANSEPQIRAEIPGSRRMELRSRS